MKPNLLIHGMYGLGDNIRQRAIIRQKIATYNVFLESTWVSVYHDLLPHGLKIIKKNTRLRTQAKNAERERDAFSKEPLPKSLASIRIWYPPEQVRATGSVLAAMCNSARANFARADFSLPIPEEWAARAQVYISLWGTKKPIMIYRPLVDRPSDWTGCNARNPDYDVYFALFNSIRDKFFVVSVADLVPKIEWTVGRQIQADAIYHRGELEFEVLAALTARASMVFTSPGFAAVLAQAVGTRVACVFGGYERSKFFFAGPQRAPCLGIDPINPCECFSHNHKCDKSTDVPLAIEQLKELTHGL